MMRPSGLLAMCWFIAALSATGATRWIPFDVVTADLPDLSGVSPIGRDVLRNPDEWTIGRSANFLVFGQSVPHVSLAVDDAENCLRQAEVWLGLPDTRPEPSLLVFIQREDQWKELVKAHGVRHDGLALQFGNEMYFKDDPGQNKRPDRVAHEVMHFQLTRTFPAGMPLWLEEGLAIHYGWKSAVLMNDQRGVAISRDPPALDEKLLVGFDDLLTIKRYPESGEQARAFFRQAEEMIAVLDKRLGDAGMSRFIRGMIFGEGDAKTRYRAATGFTDDEQAAVLEEVRSRCMAPHTR